MVKPLAIMLGIMLGKILGKPIRMSFMMHPT